AVILRHDDASPTHLRHFTPEFGIATVFLFVALLAQTRHRRLLAAEIARGVFEQLLLFVQREGHCVSLSPSTRLATTFRFTSVVPPSMELPFERSQLRVTASSSGAKPSPDQPSPRLPAASIIS